MLGEWRPCVARRDTLVFAFPRAEAEAMERRALAAALQGEAPAEASAEEEWRAARASADEGAAPRAAGGHCMQHARCCGGHRPSKAPMVRRQRSKKDLFPTPVHVWT